MIVTVHQLLEAADLLRGEPREANVELTSMAGAGGPFLVGHVLPLFNDGTSEMPATATHVGFSLPPTPGPAED